MSNPPKVPPSRKLLTRNHNRSWCFPAVIRHAWKERWGRTALA
ncbi:hypothetical protein M7I_3018 [Glarea lozoyensis 74030]|uniref:Uncharacterized protein n=1 Tax=Glarea lozoyensis (strain ATCC 74030 / MF5533) TaxID=1104152 RepID=H0EKC2_GLAL7|nr:hypothetical protein M7I_3018 [Glarea lozoyensis 74030]